MQEDPASIYRLIAPLGLGVWVWFPWTAHFVRDLTRTRVGLPADAHRSSVTRITFPGDLLQLYLKHRCSRLELDLMCEHQAGNSVVPEYASKGEAFAADEHTMRYRLE